MAEGEERTAGDQEKANREKGKEESRLCLLFFPWFFNFESYKAICNICG